MPGDPMDDDLDRIPGDPAAYHDRADAGRVLAERLARFAGKPNVVVLGLPRGGVPVAYVVAQALSAPLDVFVVRKLGVPGHEELAMGAIATGNVVVLNDEVLRELPMPSVAVQRVIELERGELARREAAYRADQPPLDLAGRIAILIDDGLATGSTMRAAVKAVRRRDPAEIVVAVPVAPAETCRQLARDADEVICALTPPSFYAVGMWYSDFSQTSDEEVRDLLARARRE